jgi:hypothetical protein
MSDTVPASSTTYSLVGATPGAVVDGVEVEVEVEVVDVDVSATAGVATSSVAASSPISLLSAALRIPMFAAMAAPPARITPATATVVMSEVRVVSERMNDGVPVELSSGVFLEVEVMSCTVRIR